MDSFGNEIGQKMRSAVKAKLLELGTGGSAGYIDDELPDYVMIMVANKRSKQQMITDLNLFLGTQTELFVTWLHEVLHKLQEVTLPAPTVPTRKRKTSQREEEGTSSCSNLKKDKKSSRKEKKTNTTQRKATEDCSSVAEEPEAPTTTTGPPVTVPVINSITDVLAGEVLEKAKKTMIDTDDAKMNIKKGKGTRDAAEVELPTPSAKVSNIVFDIPTISEISSTTEAPPNSREHDLAELAEIQKKIYAAKKHLKQLEHVNELESEDEDFLNLKDDGSVEEFNEAADLIKKQSNKSKSPIVFNKNELEKPLSEQRQDVVAQTPSISGKRRCVTPAPPPHPITVADSLPRGVVETKRSDSSASSVSRRRDDAPVRRSRERERREPPSQSDKRRSVHERLGLREVVRTEALRPRRGRQEKELYVHAFRRRVLEEERERQKEKTRNSDGNRGRVRDHDRNHERTLNKRVLSPKEQPSSTSSKIRSRQRSQLIDHSPSPRQSSGGDRSLSPPLRRQRIGSRVIVAPSKPPELSDDEDMADKPVSSIIKIRPRSPVSPSKQACKNLLLRAVAEAQRSTILCAPKQTTDPIAKVTLRLGKTSDKNKRSSKLLSRSYRDCLKRSSEMITASGNIFRRTTQNLVIEVKRRGIGLKAAQIRNQLVIENTSVERIRDEEYIPEFVADREESDEDFMYVPQVLHNITTEDQNLKISCHLDEADYETSCQKSDLDIEKTQFVVTLNDDPGMAIKPTLDLTHSRSMSPHSQVTSSSSSMGGTGSTDPSSSSISTNQSSQQYLSSHEHQHSVIKTRLESRSNSASPSTPVRAQTERDSTHSSVSSNTPPPIPRRNELVEVYRKPKIVKKIIISNDSEDDEHTSPKKTIPNEKNENHENHGKLSSNVRHSSFENIVDLDEERSTTPPLPTNKASIKRRRISESSPEKKQIVSSSPSSSSPHVKRKHTPIKFDLKGLSGEHCDGDEGKQSTPKTIKRRSKSYERETSTERRSEEDYHHHSKKISIRNTEAKKYENIPSLSSVAMGQTKLKITKPKERCKYHPNCTKHNCDFYHPSAPCKGFPNCKYGEKCIYSHPPCKFDMLCTNLDCNFSHSGPRNPSLLKPTPPPLSSHVVPVQNYKSISAASGASGSMCKYYPNCTKVGCTFYHPIPCRFGKNCIKKLECHFYHHEVQSSSKFKWVASVV